MSEDTIPNTAAMTTEEYAKHMGITSAMGKEDYAHHMGIDTSAQESAEENNEHHDQGDAEGQEHDEGTEGTGEAQADGDDHAEGEGSNDREPEWYKRRIARFARDRHAAEQRIRELEERINGSKQQAPETEEQMRGRIQRELTTQQEAADFNRRCDALANTIIQQSGQHGLQEIQESLLDSGFDVKRADHIDILNEVTGHRDSVALYKALAADHAAASAIFSASPRRQYALLEKLAEKVSGNRQPNRVASATGTNRRSAPPPPVKAPVKPGAGASGSSKRSIFDPTLTADEYAALRAAGVTE